MKTNSSRFLDVPVELKCPTCSLTFHNQPVCRRCNTDLTLLMRTALVAWKMREQARRFLVNHDYENALRAARRAQAIHRTNRGELLEQAVFAALSLRMRKRIHLRTLLFE